MYSIRNTATLYVSQVFGDDSANGLAHKADKYGNAPFKTVEKAVSVIRELRARGLERPMTISIVGDYYALAPISLRGLEHVTVEGLANSRVIGGIKVENWQKDIFNGVDCFSARLPQREDGKAWDFTDFYVNGKRAKVTRYPKEGTLRLIDTEEYFDRPYPPRHDLLEGSYWFLVKREDLEGIDNITDASINYYQWWVDGHSPIESYDKESGKLTMKYRTRFTASAVYGESASAIDYYLTGVPNAFSDKGEWYLERGTGTVYYIPESDEITAETIEAFAPEIDKLFIIEGEDIRLQGLELTATRGEYASTRLPNRGYEQFVGKNMTFGSDIQSVCGGEGSVTFENSNRCGIYGCKLHGLGVHGVEIKKNCHRIRLENNEICDTGAGGIKIEGGTALEEASLATSDCVIRKNHIHHGGKRYEAGCGILLMDASNSEISENEVHDFQYTGISVGFVWGYEESATYGNLIRGNHIYNIGNGSLSDMGGIYTLGKQSGTVIEENRIHDVKCSVYGAWGIYTDEGSSNIRIENNAVFNTGKESFHLHYGRDNVVRNNILYSENFSSIVIAKKEEHNQVVFENNIMVTNGAKIFGHDHSSRHDQSDFESYNLSKNVVFDLSGQEPRIPFEEEGKVYTVGEWEEIFDDDSGNVTKDPCIPGLLEYDFTLSPDSPAIELGLKPLPDDVAKGK